VPLWADFMKLATKGDKPEWLERPEDVIAIEICRMSGKRPADGCSHVDVVNKDGEVQTRSMVFTEYFLKGTEPSDTCDLHDSNFFQRLAGAFHKAGPTSIDQIGIAADAPAAPSERGDAAKGDRGNAAADPAHADEAKDAKKDDDSDDKKKKKGGFWSRFFGGSKKDDDKPEDKKSDDKKDDTRKDDAKKDDKHPDTPPRIPEP
jgi:hypothetical protein